MKTSSQILSMLLPVIYLFFVFIIAYIFFGRNKNLANKIPLMIIILIVVHSVQIILRGIAIEMLPLSTKFDALSFLAFTIIILTLIIEFSNKNKTILYFAVLLSLIIQSISSMFYSWNLTPHPMLSNPIYAVHVVLAILGYSAISISALYALLYIMLYHNIKYHRFGLIYEKLPSLGHLERLSISSVQIGIITLGLGILIGHLHAGDALGTYWPIDKKVIYNNIIWFGYFTGFLIAQIYNWRGRWMAYLAMVGFVILILANITLLFIKNTFHQFQ
jgi:HemX protein